MIPPPNPPNTSFRRAHIVGAWASIVIVLVAFSALSAALGVIEARPVWHFVTGTLNGVFLAVCVTGLVHAYQRAR